MSGLDKNRKNDKNPKKSFSNLPPNDKGKPNRWKNKNISLIMNFISFCDGKLSLLEIAEKLDVPMWDLYDIINVLEKQGIIKREVLNI